MKLRITLLIPAILVLSTLASSTLLYLENLRSAGNTIRAEAMDRLKLDITRLQNILYNRLTEANLREARLNLSITAMDPSVRSLLLADARDQVLLANRYLWEGSPARTVSEYDPAIARQVKSANSPRVYYDAAYGSLLTGYYPVILKLENDQGLPVKRLGTLYVEMSIATKLASARHAAIMQSLIYGGVMLAMSALVALLLHLLVSRRLARLTVASQALAGGDLAVRAAIGGNDELTELGRSFDDMVTRLREDIRRREVAEQELRELNDTLEQRVAERTALLREAQSIGRIGNWTWNVASGRLVWSDEIYRIFGYEPGAMEPSYADFLAAVHPDDLERVRRSEEAAFSLGERHSIDHRIVLPDGALRWVHEEAIATLDAAGAPLGLSGTVQDITERKLIEQSLLAAKEEAERANQAKSEFLSRMSHELRTPLNAILGFGQLLELEIREERQADNVQEILHAGRHLLELINEVLDLARIESGKFTVSLEAVPLQPLIEDCLTLIRPLAEARGIRIAAAGRDCGGHVLADCTRLKQVLLNLLSNAVKYNREQGSIGIACVPVGDAIQVRISDSGAGLTPEQRGRLFVAFERLGGDQNAVEGTGIGLALSKRLVELMHGEIGVESTPGSGSTFWVRLPVTRDHEGESADAAPLVADGQTARASGNRQWDILCIEDNPANLRLVEAILARRADIRLLSASAPGLGLELAAAHRPALILLDINLPEMDGYDVMKCLRESPATRDIPVAAISANAMPKDLERGKAAGFADYLTKPLEVERLLRVVDEVVCRAAGGLNAASGPSQDGA